MVVVVAMLVSVLSCGDTYVTVVAVVVVIFLQFQCRSCWWCCHVVGVMLKYVSVVVAIAVDVDEVVVVVVFDIGVFGVLVFGA